MSVGLALATVYAQAVHLPYLRGGRRHHGESASDTVAMARAGPEIVLLFIECSLPSNHRLPDGPQFRIMRHVTRFENSAVATWLVQLKSRGRGWGISAVRHVLSVAKQAEATMETA